jgi:hypothetical protein
MKTKIINVYEYSELDDKAKEKVLSDFRKDNQYDFLDDDMNNYLKELLDKNGIKYGADLKIYYSLSNSQGDGVCFIGFFDCCGYSVKITHNSRYYHKRSTDIFIYTLDDEGNETEATEEVYNNFKEKYFFICDLMEKYGYEYIEAEDSEENIKDNIEANGYTFRKNGEMENL